MTDLEIINPVVSVKFPTGEIRVREMYFPQALELFQRLEKRLLGLLAEVVDLRTLDNSTAALLVLRAIAGSTDDIVFILTNTTELTEAQARKLGSGVAMRLLRAALELTLNDEVLAEGKSAAGRLREAFGPKSVPPSSSLSGAGTPSLS